jgi:hypothetical protein
MRALYFYERFMRDRRERQRAFTPIGSIHPLLIETRRLVNDIVYLALGGALFAAFGGYALLLRRL